MRLNADSGADELKAHWRDPISGDNAFYYVRALETDLSLVHLGCAPVRRPILPAYDHLGRVWSSPIWLEH